MDYEKCPYVQLKDAWVVLIRCAATFPHGSVEGSCSVFPSGCTSLLVNQSLPYYCTGTYRRITLTPIGKAEEKKCRSVWDQVRWWSYRVEDNSLVMRTLHEVKCNGYHQRFRTIGLGQGTSMANKRLVEQHHVARSVQRNGRYPYLSIPFLPFPKSVILGSALKRLREDTRATKSHENGLAIPILDLGTLFYFVCHTFRATRLSSLMLQLSHALVFLLSSSPV